MKQNFAKHRSRTFHIYIIVVRARNRVWNIEIAYSKNEWERLEKYANDLAKRFDTSKTT